MAELVDALDSKSSSGDRVSVRVRPPVPLLFFAGRVHKFTLGDKVPHTHHLNLLDLLFIMGTWIVFINLFMGVNKGELYLRSSYNENTVRLERKVDLFILAFAILLSG